MGTQSKMKRAPYIIKGQKLKNKSLKLVESGNGRYEIISNTYLYGFRLRSRTYRFKSLADAEAFYERLSFSRFGYLA